MFYVIPYTLTASDTVNNKKRIDKELTAGVIHQVDVLFQTGTEYKNLCEIWIGGSKMWPTNPEAAFRGDGTVISFREFVELRGTVNTITVYFWTIDTSILKQIVVQIGLLQKELIMPLSFDALLKAIAGIS